MYTESIDDSEYRRLEDDDWNEIKGKRINGHGEIVGITNAHGEHHPAFVTTEDGEPFTPGDLMYDVEWDGRHDFIDV
jgi:hypothetical protein